MKRILLNLFLVLFFYSCQTNNEPVSNSCIKCRVSKIIYSGNKKRSMDFYYKNDTLNYIIEDAGYSIKKKIVFYRDANGKIKRFITFPVYNITDFRYTPVGNLSSISTSSLVHTFDYDSKGNLIKQITFFNRKIFQVFRIFYDNNMPVSCKLFNAGGLLKYRMYFSYDNNPNPFAGLGPLVNVNEPLYSYPVGNFKYNLSRVIIERDTSEGYLFKQKSVFDTVDFKYLYNQWGYPVSINNKVFIFYDCIDSIGRILNKKYNYDNYILENDD